MIQPTFLWVTMRISVTWFIQALLLIYGVQSLAFQSTFHSRVCILKFIFSKILPIKALQKVLNETQSKTIKHLLHIILFDVFSFLLSLYQKS